MNDHRQVLISIHPNSRHCRTIYPRDGHNIMITEMKQINVRCKAQHLVHQIITSYVIFGTMILFPLVSVTQTCLLIMRRARLKSEYKWLSSFSLFMMYFSTKATIWDIMSHPEAFLLLYIFPFTFWRNTNFF